MTAPGLLITFNAGSSAVKIGPELHGKLDEHHRYVREYGEDMPEVQDWRWPG